MKHVVVESPAKAKTINKYLGSDFTVLASNGHIRDLPAKDGSVRPDEDFAMTWQSKVNSEKQIREIKKALKGADNLILATDPDREGEAISWHVKNVLEEQHALAGIPVQRVVFNEITKTAVLDAMAKPRELDQTLVDAYFARRALDYLVGFTLSPVLWRKLPGSRSAGRVQSVALRLICEREAEIEAFRPREYWTIDVSLRSEAGKPFSGRLTHVDGKRLDKYDLKNETDALAAQELIERSIHSVTSIERKRVRRNPQPPFTTSTLQQEASRKLGMGASRTMQIAQRLYEGVDIGGETVGLITYMRTDGVQMSQESVIAIREVINSVYGNQFLPVAPRVYRARAKNAQEAHEAIRPTDATRAAKDVSRFLDHDQARLYELIWKRAVASQMASAELDQTAVVMQAADKRTTLRANGSIVAFQGFLTLYQEDRDEPAAEGDDNDDRILPAMKEGESLGRNSVTPEQHFTQPPSRFTEASLVKRMEELGIGRPSTYHNILQVLQDRNYVLLEKRRFLPEDRGRLVTAFLVNFFERYVQYNFTADLEGELDGIAEGKFDWKIVLKRFWSAFSSAVDNTKDLRVSEVLDTLDEELGRHFFPDGPNGESTRGCPLCSNGRLSLKLGRYGAFIGCSNYPDCRHTRQFSVVGELEDPAQALDEPRLLGKDPDSGKDVSLRKGPYGYYIQLGEQGEKKSEKPKRASLTKNMQPAGVSLEVALGLLRLPRNIGAHTESGEMITAGIGRYGPYLKHGMAYTSIPADDDVLTIGLNRAIDLIATNERKRPPAKSIGDSGGKPVTVRSGRYGPYVQLGQVRATLPKNLDKDSITLEEALKLIEAKASKLGKGKAVKKGAAKTTKKKTKDKSKNQKPSADQVLVSD
ncbi:MAG: DNA topoisomerase I [Rhodospirillaceae bacterium]|nr:DNA topoisomerase I [Rhodospirillaceae bacterium]